MEGNPNGGQGEKRVAVVAELTVRLLDNGQVACHGPLGDERLMMLLCAGALQIAANAQKPSPIVLPGGAIPPVPPLRLLRNGK